MVFDNDTRTFSIQTGAVNLSGLDHVRGDSESDTTKKNNQADQSSGMLDYSKVIPNAVQKISDTVSDNPQIINSENINNYKKKKKKPKNQHKSITLANKIHRRHKLSNHCKHLQVIIP